MRLDGNFLLRNCDFVSFRKGERIATELLQLLHRELQKTIQNQVGHRSLRYEIL